MKGMMRRAALVGGVYVACASFTHAVAGDPLPEGAKPLDEVITALENEGYTDISEISMDDGAWEVEAVKDGHAREIKVDPMTGKILSDRKDN